MRCREQAWACRQVPALVYDSEGRDLQVADSPWGLSVVAILGFATLCAMQAAQLAFPLAGILHLEDQAVGDHLVGVGNPVVSNDGRWAPYRIFSSYQ